MPIYPPAVTGNQAGDLYATHTTRKYKLGTIAQFETTNGVVEAMYVENNNAASVAAGLAVGIGAKGWGYVDTAAVANASVMPEMILGGLAASVQSSGAATGKWGWVIMRGPQTNAFWATTLTSSAGVRGIYISSNAAITTCLTTQLATIAANTTVSVNPRPVGIVEAFSVSNITASGTGAATVGPAFIQWIWR